MLLLTMMADMCSLTPEEHTLIQLVVVAALLVTMMPFLSFGSSGGPERTGFCLALSELPLPLSSYASPVRLLGERGNHLQGDHTDCI